MLLSSEEKKLNDKKNNLPQNRTNEPSTSIDDSKLEDQLFNENHNLNHHGHSHFNVDLFHRPNSMLSFFILMFATSIHSLFEGINVFDYIYS